MIRHHLPLRYCPDCQGILDGTRVGDEEYCEKCDEWKVGVDKFPVATGPCGHDVTEMRRKVGRRLEAWCSECNEWVRLTYSRVIKKTVVEHTQEEIPF